MLEGQSEGRLSCCLQGWEVSLRLTMGEDILILLKVSKSNCLHHHLLLVEKEKAVRIRELGSLWLCNHRSGKSTMGVMKVFVLGAEV